MDLLKQCQQWFEQNELQKVIDALEAIPAGERTPELDSELAKAYIAIAEIGEAGRALYELSLIHIFCPPSLTAICATLPPL